MIRIAARGRQPEQQYRCGQRDTRHARPATTITFKVTDANGTTDTVTCYIVVAGSALNIDCGTCGTKGTVGSAYSAMFAVTGGTGPYTFSITYGSLPAGLTLDRYTGKITGTPRPRAASILRPRSSIRAATAIPWHVR